jgi:hypothetical protein
MTLWRKSCAAYGVFANIGLKKKVTSVYPTEAALTKKGWSIAEISVWLQFSEFSLHWGMPSPSNPTRRQIKEANLLGPPRGRWDVEGHWWTKARNFWGWPYLVLIWKYIAFGQIFHMRTCINLVFFLDILWLNSWWVLYARSFADWRKPPFHVAGASQALAASDGMTCFEALTGCYIGVAINTPSFVHDLPSAVPA